MLPKYRSIGSLLECRQRRSEVVLKLISKKKTMTDKHFGGRGGTFKNTVLPEPQGKHASSLDIPPTQIKVYLQDL